MLCNRLGVTVSVGVRVRSGFRVSFRVKVTTTQILNQDKTKCEGAWIQST